MNDIIHKKRVYNFVIMHLIMYNHKLSILLVNVMTVSENPTTFIYDRVTSHMSISSGSVSQLSRVCFFRKSYLFLLLINEKRKGEIKKFV